MFRMIGHYEIAREGDVIRVRSAPEFNLEAAQQYAADMLALIAQMPRTFGTLVEFEAPPIIGPEVEAAMHRSAIERAQRGMVGVAFVTQSLDGIRVASAQWHRIYDGTGVEFGTFQDVAPAQDWLRERIESRRRRDDRDAP
jgi:hypothetical protein